MLNKKILVVSVMACFTVAAVAWAATTATPLPSYQIAAGTKYSVVVDDVQISPYPAKNLFGTHSLWWGTQADLVQSNGTIYPAFANFLKTTGGIVRYGGGADEISYKSCAGTPAARVAVKAVDWAGLMKCSYGIPEYIATVKAVGGDTSWTLANIAGINYKLFTSDELDAEATQAATYVKSQAPTLTRYWELGNELERGKYKWSPEFLASRASQAAKAIRKVDPDAKFVLPLIEFDASWQPAKKVFNERLLRAMTQPVNGIAFHLYYDGPPSGPTVSTQFSTVTDAAKLYKTVTGTDAAIWITEHARWPQGESLPNWSDFWYRTNDMDGLLGTADFLLTASQIPEVAGLMLHGVRAGPWNVFDKVAGKDPTLTGVGMLYTTLAASKPSLRMQTRTTSMNQSQYKGGYDLRAGAFKTADKKSLAIWMVNRNTAAITVATGLPASMSSAALTSSTVIDCTIADGKCGANDFRRASLPAASIARAGGNVTLKLPARSISVLVFTAP
jgi:hypothetical protein